MNIGEASDVSGVTAKMIRYYESIGLVPEAERRASGYRDYGAKDVHRLRFIRRARDLNFSMEQIRELLRLWSDQHRSNADVKRIALRHIAELEERAHRLQEMADALRGLAAGCDGDGRPDCPIIEGLGRPTRAPRLGEAEPRRDRTGHGTELSAPRRLSRATASGRTD